LGLDEATSRSQTGTVDIAVIRLPRIANFDEFAPLAAEPSVRLRYVERADQLGQPDLAIIPGTKTTVADLEWLRQTGLADRLTGLAASATPLIGICGGYQMLGRAIHDPHAAESDHGSVPGLGLLPVETTFATTKRTVRIEGTLLATRGPLGGAEGSAVVAYEIHMGRSVADADLAPLVRITHRSGETVNELDGLIAESGLIAGTYLHGLFENDAARHALIDGLLARSRSAGPDSATLVRRNLAADRAYQLDRLAETVRASLDLQPLLAACGLG
jgi:adenosylcobyric acid synthase